MLDRALFAVLILLALVPVWTVDYMPTTDGPCHTYNAWVLRQYNSPRHPLFREHYEIDHRPLPNWLSHAVLASLMFVVPPPAAEKLLVSGALALFLLGAWMLAGAVDRERRWLALLAFPLAFNQLFQMGFYNFSLGLGLWMVVVAWWWRRRADPGLGFALGLNGLLLLLYFAHLVPHLLALLTIAVLWLVTLRRATWKRHLLHIAILLPQAVLPLWYVASTDSATIPSATPLATALRHFVELHVLYSLGEPQTWLGRLVAVVFLLLVILTLAEKLRAGSLRAALGEADAFLLVAALGVILYLVSPEGVGSGIFLKNRLSLFPWLALLPWLSMSRWKGFQRSLLAVLACLAITDVAYLADRYRAVDREVRGLVSAAAPIAPNSRVLPLLFDRQSGAIPFALLGHAFSYAAIDKGLIDWDNYEAGTGLFPLRFRATVFRPAIYELESDPGDLFLRAYAPVVDYVFCWKMPDDVPVAHFLRRHYELVADHGPVRVYKRPDALKRRLAVAMRCCWAVGRGKQKREDGEVARIANLKSRSSAPVFWF